MPQYEDTCSTCGQESCRCIECGSCTTRIDPETDSFCSNCDYCDDCCECSMCSSCGELSADRCSTCARCDSCGCHCWYCRGCGEYHTSSEAEQCSSCERCEDQCECVTCGSCGERTSELACSECNRCNYCGCDCLDVEDDDEPTDDGPLCTICNRRLSRCYCLNCHTIDQETGLITETHPFNPRSGRPEDVYCRQCARCSGHCSATSCPECSHKAHNMCEVCGKCGNCCRCIFCAHNGGRHVLENEGQRCSSCSRCNDHCSCPKCKKCGDRTRRLCRWCKSCNECCMVSSESECRAMDRSQPVARRKPDTLRMHRPSRKELRRLPNPRLIGVEPEINGISSEGLGKARHLHEALNRWGDSVVTDGSIGDQPTAFEINMTPSGGDLFLDHAKDIADGLKKMNAQPDKRCGMHVHIDASDLEVYDLRRVIELYAKVERALYGLCHPERISNHYSTPCAKFYLEKASSFKPREFRATLTARLYNEDKPITYDKGATITLEKVQNFCRSNWGTDYSWAGEARQRELEERARGYMRDNAGSTIDKVKGLKETKYHSLRYKALNLHSYFLRKTIEFRHHEGTADYEQMVGWAQVCQELVSASLRLSKAQIEALPRNSRKALIALMPERLQSYITETWKKHDELLQKNSSWRAASEGEWGA